MILYYRFNTLYVVGSKSKGVETYRVTQVSIHYMLLVQEQRRTISNSSNSVSIHYMLLVQLISTMLEDVVATFQYIICCWFKKYLNNLLKDGVSFNTLYVVGSRTYYLAYEYPIAFQYIICCWFKINNSICTI